MLGQRLGQQQTAAAARDDDPQAAGVGLAAGRVEQRRDVGAHGVDVDRQAQVRGRAAPAARGARRARTAGRRRAAGTSNDAVAAQQPLVGRGDDGLGRGRTAPSRQARWAVAMGREC